MVTLSVVVLGFLLALLVGESLVSEAAASTAEEQAEDHEYPESTDAIPIIVVRTSTIPVASPSRQIIARVAICALG